jgi:hypothetical protein
VTNLRSEWYSSGLVSLPVPHLSFFWLWAQVSCHLYIVRDLLTYGFGDSSASAPVVFDIPHSLSLVCSTCTCDRSLPMIVHACMYMTRCTHCLLYVPHSLPGGPLACAHTCIQSDNGAPCPCQVAVPHHVVPCHSHPTSCLPALFLAIDRLAYAYI